MRSVHSCCRSSLTLTVLLVLASAGSALGQYTGGFRGSQSANTLDRTLQSGRLLGRGGGLSFSSGGISQQGLANSRSAAVSFGGRASAGSPLAFRGTGTIGRTGGTALMIPFGRSPSAVTFGGPVYSGRGGYYPPIPPQVSSDSIARILRGDQRMVYDRSFLNRAFGNLEGGAIRDDLTNTSLANTAPIDLDASDGQAPRQSPVERMAAHLEARRLRYLADGWEAIRQGEFVKADGYLQNAALINREAIEPSVGRLLCAVADKRFITASTLIELLVERHDNPFEMQRPLNEVFADESVRDEIMDSCAAEVNVEAPSANLVALHVYLLWIDGRESAAIKSASERAELFRGTVFAGFGDRMQKQIEERDAGAADAALGLESSF